MDIAPIVIALTARHCPTTPPWCLIENLMINKNIILQKQRNSFIKKTSCSLVGAIGMRLHHVYGFIYHQSSFNIFIMILTFETRHRDPSPTRISFVSMEFCNKKKN